MSNRTQEHRLLEITSTLGENVLLAHTFFGTEELGRPFRFEMELLSEKPDIKFEDLMGKPVSLRVNNERDGERFFHGIVSQMSQSFQTGELTRYRVTIVPWLWLLTRVSDCRIFQQKSVPEIVKQVFRDRGFQDFEEKLNETYDPWEYCVQYRETDFNFVSRLLEQEGIYYYFKHEKDKHTLVLADAPSSHEKFPDENDQNHGTIPFYPPTEGGLRDPRIDSWTVQKQVQPGAYALTDFNPLKPKTDLESKSAATREHAHGSMEIFDYPGEYDAASAGEGWVKIRLQELHARYETISASTDCGWVFPGGVFTLEDPTSQLREDQLREYLVQSCTYHASQDVFTSGSGGGEEDDAFSVQFSVIPHTQTFRPERSTPKPMIQGPQTAIVVTANDEDLQVDEHARVRVKFHWDRHGDATHGDTSCWIRVAQVWAGKKWGSIYIPRKGQEVVVEFMEGDPDQPLITGRVYNGECQPPYPLPDQKTVSTIKSYTTPDGGNFNELYFDDKKDNEVLFLRTARDMTLRVLKQLWVYVGENRDTIIEKDSHEEVKNERHIKVGKDNFEEYGKDRHVTVDGKQASAVTESLSLTVNGDVNEAFKANQTTEVTGDLKIQAMTVKITGMTTIKLECGGSSIEMTPGSITIKAPALTVQAAATFAMPVTMSAPVTAAAAVTVGGPITAGGPITSGGPVTATSIVSPTYTPGAGNIL